MEMLHSIKTDWLTFFVTYCKKIKTMSAKTLAKYVKNRHFLDEGSS